MEDLQPPAFARNEAMGDLSGLKGSYYHLAYALSLLLSGETPQISFYAGNDLLSHPPAQMEDDGSAGIHSSSGTHECWSQLKNTDPDRPWTVNQILSDETLVLNFLLNALWSEYRQRTWDVRLVSPSPIRRQDIRAFLATPQDKPKLQEKFEAVVSLAYQEWSEWLEQQGAKTAVSMDSLRDLGSKVLEQVADSPVVPAAQIAYQIESALRDVFPDRITATQVAFALRGALQDVGDVESAQPLEVTLGWLAAKIGHRSLRPQDLLSNDPVRASDAQVEDSLPERWSAHLCAPRPALVQEMKEFTGSDRTLFVLTGDGGSGKSWASAQQASQEFHGCLRARISGSLIPSARSLTRLVADVFRPFARAEETDEEIARRVYGAAADPARGPFILIADDIPLVEDVTGFTETLERLCQEARKKAVKLVLIARHSIWQRLASQRRLDPYLYRRTNPLQDAPLHSHSLATLTDREMRDILERRLPASAGAHRIALQLRHPAFVSLRNPYLLGLYVDQHLASSEQRSESLKPVSVDALLDTEIIARYTEVARRAECDISEMVAAAEALVERLWSDRRSGAQPNDLIRLLEAAVSHLGRKVFFTLQAEDVLTSSGDLRTPGGNVIFANPLFGDRLTAQWLAQRMRAGADVVAELEPGLDDGVVTALLREAIDSAVPDPQAWAEVLLERDPRWLYTLSQGLAQRRDDSWRSLARLTAWANRKEQLSAWNAMRALGSMTAWSSRAREWVAVLYADEEAHQRFLGQIALGAALNVVPGWAKRRIRLRLRRELGRVTSTSGDSRTQATFLEGALDPLQQLSHSEAAAVAQDLLEWFQSRYRTPRPPELLDVREQFEGTVDTIRGQIAMYGGDEEIRVLLEELSAEDNWIRRRAARALLPIAHDCPERIKEAVFAQARVEQSLQPHLLHLLVHYTQSDPDRVLETLAANNPFRSSGCGLGLALLMRIARTRPAQVRALLPDNLNQLPPDWRAVLAEPMALAWWQYAAAAPQDAHAREVLETLSIPDYEGVSDQSRAFAARGASVAVLARIGLDVQGMSEAAGAGDIYFHHLAMDIGADALYAELHTVWPRFSAAIAAHPLAPSLSGLLTETTHEHFLHRIHPIEPALSEWQFRVAFLAADALASLALHMADPASMVEHLPRSWPALRVCNALLEAGQITEALAAYGCGVCAERANEWGNVSRDRDMFVSRLHVQGRLPAEHVGLTTHPGPWGDGGTTRMDVEAEHAPEVLIELLHSHVTKENAVPFLWKWSCESTNWRIVLLGHAFRAMFWTRSLTLRDCSHLCECIIAATADRPGSSFWEHRYRAGYLHLLEFCDADYSSVAASEPLQSLRNSQMSGDDLLSRSYQAAEEVLRAFSEKAGRLDGEWFEAFIANTEGWVEDESHWIEDGTIHNGFGIGSGSIYIPPALHLALTVTSLRALGRDFVADWTDRWRAVPSELQEGPCRYVLNGQCAQFEEEHRHNTLQSAAEQVQVLAARFPQDAFVQQLLGHIFLLQHHFPLARQACERSLSLPCHRMGVHITARYNLACAFARLGMEEECRRELTAALQAQPFLPGHIRLDQTKVADDADFAAIRERNWFQLLIETLPATASGSTVAGLAAQEHSPE